MYNDSPSRNFLIVRKYSVSGMYRFIPRELISSNRFFSLTEYSIGVSRDI